MSELSPAQLDQIVEKLDADYESLRSEVREEIGNPDDRHRIDQLNEEPGDVGDESLASALADVNATRFERHIRALADIEAAVKRTRNGEFGVCVDCGQSIAFARLLAYPTATRCIVCQEKREKEYAHEGRPSL